MDSSTYGWNKSQWTGEPWIDKLSKTRGELPSRWVLVGKFLRTMRRVPWTALMVLVRVLWWVLI